MRKLILATLMLFSLVSNAWSTGSTGGAGKCGPADSYGYFGVGYVVPNMAATYEPVGFTWTRIPGVSWGFIEPDPGVYNWNSLDSLVVEWQAAGFDIQMVLKSSNPWASPNYQGPTVGQLPSSQYRDDYANWVEALVERYDGDGFSDAPGLLRPVLAYEIESEAQNIPFSLPFWLGTKEEYGQLLSLAHDAVKAACQNASVILSGLNIADLFIGEPDEQELADRIQQYEQLHPGALDFIQYTLGLIDDYDAIELHYSRDYQTLPHEIAWVRQYMQGANKEIWAGDAISTVFLWQWMRAKPLPYSDDQIWDDVSANKDTAITRWFRAEQSRVSVKKLVTGIAEGLVGLNLQRTRDEPDNERSSKNWFISGMEDRPVYYAVSQLIARLSGYTGVVRMVSPEGVYVYLFSFSAGPPMVVAWSENGPQNFSFGFGFPVIVEAIITSGTTADPFTVSPIGGRINVSLDETPKLVYIP